MVKIIVDEDCNNAPKKQYVKDFLIAAATSDSQTVSDMLADNISLEIVGQQSAGDKASVVQLLATHESKGGVAELAVNNILSHGNKCAADGTVSFKDGSKVSFCSMYTFTSHSKDAKIKDITAYMIALKD